MRLARASGWDWGEEVMDWVEDKRLRLNWNEKKVKENRQEIIVYTIVSKLNCRNAS